MSFSKNQLLVLLISLLFCYFQFYLFAITFLLFSVLWFSALTFVVQLLSCIRLFVTPWTAAHQASLSFTISRSLPRLMSVESVMPSKHLILCCCLLPRPQSFPASVFSSESARCIRWPKYWSFSFNVSPSNEYSGLISFKIDWFDLLALHGTLKSPLLLSLFISYKFDLFCSSFLIPWDRISIHLRPLFFLMHAFNDMFSSKHYFKLYLTNLICFIFIFTQFKVFSNFLWYLLFDPWII